MRDAAVIFDTNAYIDFCETYDLEMNSVLHEVENLRERERLLNIDSYVAPPVLLELFSHLATPNDPYYERCKCSLLALYRHTQIDISIAVKLVPDSESLLTRFLFNYQYQELINKWEEIANLLAPIYARPDENSISMMRNDFQQIHEYVDDVENQFISDMLNFVVRGLNSSAQDWAPLVNDDTTRRRFLNYINSEEMLNDLAKMYVIKTCGIAGIEISDIDLDTLAEDVRSNFPAPLYLYLIILKRIAETGCDITKRSRRNWIWDMQLLFYVTPNTITDKEIYLISSDGDMGTAAAMCGMRNNVVRFNDYLNLI